MSKKKNDFLLTTIDNPWNPFTNFDDWNQFDNDYGYCTWQRIDKLMPIDYSQRSSGEINWLVTNAMEKLIALFPNVYIKVFESDENVEETKKKYKKQSELVKKL